MNIWMAVASMALLAVAGCATTSQPDQRTIVVDGTATLSLDPEIFTVAASLRSRNSDQAAGLAELSERIAKVRATLPGLKGLKSLRIETSEIELTGIRDPACREESGYDSDDTCPITGRFANAGLRIVGGPANLAGQAISLLSELGAETVELTSYGVADPKAANAKALEAAVADARAKADAIARASGSVVTGVAKIQYGAGFGSDRYGIDPFSIQGMSQEFVPAVSVVLPETDLDLEPRPIEVEAKVVAAFTLD